MTEFISFLFGILIHQTKQTTDRLPAGFDVLSKYCVGVVAGWLTWPFFARKQGMDERNVERGKAAFSLAFLFLGAGVVIGWLIDTFLRRKE